MIDYLASNMEKCVAATTAVSHFEASINWLISNGINSAKFSCSKQSILQTGLKKLLKKSNNLPIIWPQSWGKCDNSWCNDQFQSSISPINANVEQIQFNFRVLKNLF